MIQLKDVYEDYGLSCVVLFELLRRRLPNESISHREMPSWEMHCGFVARRPYEAWYLVEDDGLAVGAVYLSKQREIGISILPARRRRGYAEAAVRALMELQPGRFLWNVNPENSASISLAIKLGFGPEPIQYTYAKEPGMKPPFIVAEMSANHLGSLKRALDIVEAAKEAGADAIKVQTWSPGTMCISDYTLDHGPWAGRKLRDLYEEAFLPWEWHKPIFERARRLGLVPFSAAFDWEAVDFLETLGVDRHKVASFELTDLPLIRYMAGKGKPMILSTGMATEREVDEAVFAAHNEQPLTILKCVSAYPTPLERMNLLTMPDLRTHSVFWHDSVGLSDHTLGHECAMLATALGATMIEKHLTLSRADGGPDAGFSLEPQEFANMVLAVKRAAAALGDVKYGPGPGEDPTLRRSLWVRHDTAQGEPIRFGENVVTARPALGLSPGTSLVGKFAARPLKAGTPLQLEDLA